MEPCTILDLGILTEITDEYHKDSIHMRIRDNLLGRGPLAMWFLLGDCCMCYESIGVRKFEVHIYSVSRDRRGKELRDFAIEAGRWMLDNTSAEVFLNFVEPDRRDLMLFMKMIGSEKIVRSPALTRYCMYLLVTWV